jgi:hypothetical protein
MNFNYKPFGVKVRYLCFGTHFNTEFERTHFTEHDAKTSGRTHSRVSCEEDLHIITVLLNIVDYISPHFGRQIILYNSSPFFVDIDRHSLGVNILYFYILPSIIINNIHHRTNLPQRKMILSISGVYRCF